MSLALTPGQEVAVQLSERAVACLRRLATDCQRVRLLLAQPVGESAEVGVACRQLVETLGALEMEPDAWIPVAPWFFVVGAPVRS